MNTEEIDALAEAIAAALAKHLKPPDPNQLFDHADLARMFRVSRSTIFRRAKEEQWPRTRIGDDGKTDRFTQQDVDAIIAMHHQEPVKKTVPKVGTRANRRSK